MQCLMCTACTLSSKTAVQYDVQRYIDLKAITEAIYIHIMTTTPVRAVRMMYWQDKHIPWC